MIDVRRILCPTDFSECSETALRHAVALARWYGADIDGLHVVPVLPRWDVPADPETGEAESRVAHFLAPAREAGVRTAAHVAGGDAAHEILARAEVPPIDVVVMGTHGRGGLRRLTLGSVAETVVRQAACPVLTLRAHEPPPRIGRPPFKTMLCAVDFSPASEKALTFGMAMAEEADAELVVLHAVEPYVDRDIQRRVHLDPDAYWRAVERQATTRLEGLLPPDVREWCRVRTKVALGRPADEILRASAEEGIELVIMGVHGRGVLHRAIFGSVAQQVVRQAGCPVLTLAPHVRAEAMPLETAGSSFSQR